MSTSQKNLSIKLNLRDRLLGLNRTQKRILQLAADVAIIWLALWLAFYLRLDNTALIEPFSGHAWLFMMAPLVSLPVFITKGFYRAVMRFVGYQASVAIFEGVTIATIMLGIVIYIGPNTPAVPRSVIFIYWLLMLVMVGGLRMLMRSYFNCGSLRLSQFIPFYNGNHVDKDDKRRKVLIYGAGHSGNQLLTAIRMGSEMRVVGFIDDNPDLVGRVIAGVPIFDPTNLGGVIIATEAQKVLLAIPSATRSRRLQIINALAPYKVLVRTVPGMMDLVSGKIKVQDLREVDIADLLGRDPVAPNMALFEQCVKQQVVMVTGAGGSIGSELCRQIVHLQPKVLILFEHSEFALYDIHREISLFVRNKQLDLQVVPILGSIRNQSRLFDVMSGWKVDTVYHAAAYKHVPMVEHNIAEGVRNNIFGTLYTAQSAIRAHVKNFVLISTDKAVRPTNIMGSTKRMAELVLQALARESTPVLFGAEKHGRFPNQTRFTMVRFGNVLGSSGSVIPLFRKQINAGGPLTVTHPDITRYFMTIPEAAQLVIQAGSMGKGGDVFVLDMGEPVKIIDLAKKMIQLSGLTVKSKENPAGDIEIKFSGLRPGEKLYEELLIGSNVSKTEHPMIQRANELHTEWEVLKQHLLTLDDSIRAYDYQKVRDVFHLLVEGFKPDEHIVDWVHKQQAELRENVQLPEYVSDGHLEAELEREGIRASA